MPQSNEYVAILRCQTWNVWPEKVGVEHHSFEIHYGAPATVPARLLIISYVNRSEPEKFLNEETKVGQLIWDGTTRGFHRVRDTILKAPEDQIEVSLQLRNTQRGEVDICINFKFEGDIPPAFFEAARATAFAIMSLVNLQLQDYLTPTAPFQLRKILPGGGGQGESRILVSAQNRQALEKETLEATLSGIASTLNTSRYGAKLRIALELYATHFTEQQIQVRFLLLVMAMESLATPTQKQESALTLIQRWREELKTEMFQYAQLSEDFKCLEALSRELDFRGEDSIRSQVRKLFVGLSGVDDNESEQLQRRVLRVYDKRSALVHNGNLPDGELSTLEREARELLEKVFASAVSQTNTSPAKAPQQSA